MTKSVKMNLDIATTLMRGYVKYFTYKTHTISSAGNGNSGRYEIKADYDMAGKIRDLVPNLVFRFVDESIGKHSLLELACRAQIAEKIAKRNEYAWRPYHYKIRDTIFNNDGIAFQLERIPMAHMR